MTRPRPIALLFALPDESKDVRQAMEIETQAGRGVNLIVQGRWAGAPVLVAHTGVGAEAAARKTREIVREHAPAVMISAGFAGGLQAEAKVGMVVIDRRGSARFAALPLPEGCLFGRLVSAPRVVEIASEKA